MPHFSSFAGFRWGCEAGQTVGTWKCKAFCRSVRLKSRSIRARWNNFETLFIEKDIMYRCWIDGNRTKRQTVILWSERRNVLKMCQDSKMSCHQRKHWLEWDKVFTDQDYRDVRPNVLDCYIFMKRKKLRKAKNAPIQIGGYAYPMERIALDIMGPLPVTKKGNKFVLVIQDYFTKWV